MNQAEETGKQNVPDRRRTAEQMRRLMETVICNDEFEGRHIDYWEWNQGVGLFGVVKAHEASGNAAYLDFLTQWFEKNKGTRRFGSVNCVIPAYAAYYLFRQTGGEDYRQICEEYADWAKNGALRTTNGGLAHVWSVGGLEDYKNQLWADSVFMAGIFMIVYGSFGRDRELFLEGIHQFSIHIKCLFDSDSELFSHGYHCLEQKRLGAHWGRGNGWIAAALAEILPLIKEEDEAADFAEVFVRVMERAYHLRAESGMLHTLLDAPDSYEEATASMLFGYAALAGYRMGILDGKFAKWARQIAASLRFYENGAVQQASGGTDCQDAPGYYNIPYTQSSYADGITLMFLSALLGYGKGGAA